MPRYEFNPFTENDSKFKYKIVVDHGNLIDCTACYCDTDEGWVEYMNPLFLEEDTEPMTLRSEYFDFDVIEKKTGAVVASHRVSKETRARLYQEFVKQFEAKLGKGVHVQRS